jgi:hypothetical protein
MVGLDWAFSQAATLTGAVSPGVHIRIGLVVSWINNTPKPVFSGVPDVSPPTASIGLLYNAPSTKEVTIPHQPPFFMYVPAYFSGEIGEIVDSEEHPFLYCTITAPIVLGMANQFYTARISSVASKEAKHFSQDRRADQYSVATFEFTSEDHNNILLTSTEGGPTEISMAYLGLQNLNVTYS